MSKRGYFLLTPTDTDSRLHPPPHPPLNLRYLPSSSSARSPSASKLHHLLPEGRRSRTPPHPHPRRRNPGWFGSGRPRARGPSPLPSDGVVELGSCFGGARRPRDPHLRRALRAVQRVREPLRGLAEVRPTDPPHRSRRLRARLVSCSSFPELDWWTGLAVLIYRLWIDCLASWSRVWFGFSELIVRIAGTSSNDRHE